MSTSSATDISAMTASGVVVGPAGSRIRLHGFTARATGGDVDVNLRDGDANGAPLLCLHLLDGQTAGDSNTDGVFAASGSIFYEHLSGGENLVGSIFTNAKGD